jgi:hypothetical protein
MNWLFVFCLLSIGAFAQEDSTCSVSEADALTDLSVDMSNVSTRLYDSLADECPTRPPYPDLFSGINNIFTLRREVDERFSSLGIDARWSRQLGAGSWESFSNTPEDIARLKRPEF